MNKNTSKWNKTGLLDGLTNEIDKTLLANNLEECSQFIINKVNNIPNEEYIMERISGLILPIMVRLFVEKNIRVIDNMEMFYHKFDDFFGKNYQLYVDLSKSIARDGEAEFCSMYVESYKNL